MTIDMQIREIRPLTTKLVRDEFRDDGMEHLWQLFCIPRRKGTMPGILFVLCLALLTDSSLYTSLTTRSSKGSSDLGVESEISSPHPFFSFNFHTRFRRSQNTLAQSQSHSLFQKLNYLLLSNHFPAPYHQLNSRKMYSKTVAIIGFFAAAASTGVVAQSTTATVTDSALATAASSAAVLSSAPPAAAANGTASFAFFNTTVTTTLVVNALTTVCAEATTLTFNGCEYPATAGEIVTVTNCPCTITTAQQILTSSLCEKPFPKPTGAPVMPPAPPGVTAIPVPAATSAPAAVGSSGGSSTLYAVPSGPSAVPTAVQLAGAPPAAAAGAAGFVGAVAVAALVMGVVAVVGL
ncbi:hypothetical protein F5X96DRAFT_665850 [Biscogniauxia mediterranea]|nr:hypothetical protein F5X96DRAFT_665850 [Biscogniauxia mediterranea]